MNKNWLIRTKNNHILGPVSKEKIKDLISSGSIKGDDEVCSGNGYWIYIREQELLSKYVMGDLEQSFNPVQEAPRSPIIGLTVEEPVTESNLPDASDLEYPEIGVKEEEEVASDITVNMNIKDIQSGSDKPELESEREEENIALKGDDSNVVSIKEKEPSTANKEQRKPAVKATKRRRIVPTAEDKKLKERSSKLSINFLYIVAFLFLLLAAISFKFKKTILDEINRRVSYILIPSAIAQDNLTIPKKKSGLSSRI